MFLSLYRYQLIFLIIFALPLSATSFAAFPTVRSSKRRDAQGCLGASSSDNNDGYSLDLFAWARQHGAKISESVEIRSTAYGVRGMFAGKDISANTELITIPVHLQLGVTQLAEGTDTDMQELSRALPWQYILNEGLNFLPLSVALCAEKRKEASIFEPYLNELPVDYTNAVAPSDDFGTMKGEPKDLNVLETWAPGLGQKVLSRRNGIISIHEQLAPPSLSFEELSWAAATVCSRSLVRKSVRELTTDQSQLVGTFCASDHSRLLPVIDLVNHGSLDNANARVGHLGAINKQDFSSSLFSTREIAAGEELLFDYGGACQQVSNERLLLDYGFVLPDHTQEVALRLEDFLLAISSLADYRMEMIEVSEDEKKKLSGLITKLIELASSVQVGAPVRFTMEGRPSVRTLALALAMTCRGQDDVDRLLKPVRKGSDDQDSSLLPLRLLKNCSEAQKEFALVALRRAATMALAERQSIDIEPTMDGGGGFANVAREYSIMCREMLQRVADMPTSA